MHNAMSAIGLALIVACIASFVAALVALRRAVASRDRRFVRSCSPVDEGLGGLYRCRLHRQLFITR